jgi:hypothetical protein
MIQHEISSNPAINLILSVTLALLGNLLGGLGEIAIPLIVMQFFQILAWFSAFVIMLVTVYKTFKKDKYKEENK